MDGEEIFEWSTNERKVRLGEEKREKRRSEVKKQTACNATLSAKSGNNWADGESGSVKKPRGGKSNKDGRQD